MVEIRFYMVEIRFYMVKIRFYIYRVYSHGRHVAQTNKEKDNEKSDNIARQNYVIQL